LLHDLAVTVENDVMRLRIVERGARVVEGCLGRLPSEDLARLEQRLAAIEGLMPMARDERRRPA
jgi:hypothetical protein